MRKCCSVFSTASQNGALVSSISRRAVPRTRRSSIERSYVSVSCALLLTCFLGEVAYGPSDQRSPNDAEPPGQGQGVALRATPSNDVDSASGSPAQGDGFVACFTGPDISLPSGCAAYDLNQDERVDLRDVQVLQVRYAPTNNPSPTPYLWQLQPALAPASTDQDPQAPVVDVVAAAAATPPTPGDLEPTIDVQITQEIIDKAAELGNDPSAIYEFVRNDFAFQAYYGSQKGSVETLRQRAGNDYDLASLLIALLRAANIPARYAVGMVEMPADRAMSWLAVDDADVAGSILYTEGLEGMGITDGGIVVAVRARRVWVEAYVPRGYGSPAWVPLDPAFKLHTVHAGVDIPAEMGLDAQAFVDEYYDPSDPGVTLPRSETVLELLKQEITAYLDANHPGMTLADAMRTQEITPENLGALPASLPYTVRSRDTSFSEIPAARRYQIRFHLHNGGTNLINHTLDLPTIAGKRITIDYVACTPADQAIIDAAGGIYQVPDAQIQSVDLKPVLRLAGQDLVVGTNCIGMGQVHESDMYFLAPTNAQGFPHNEVPAIYNTITCGASQAIGLAVEGVSERLLLPPPADDTEGMASLLYDTAMDYMGNCRNSDLLLGRLFHAYITTGVADAIVENVVNVTYDIWGNPQSFDWVALRVDADRSILGIWPVDHFVLPDPETKDIMILGGAEGSLFESRIYEDSYGQDSVSTIKIFQLACDAGLTIYKRWSTLPLPSNTQPTVVRNALAAAINIGHVVSFPADPITAGDPTTGEWTGTGWIDMDPATGAAGYIISGNHNGGATVEVWPPEFIDLSQDNKTIKSVEVLMKGGVSPVGDSPHADAIFTRDNEEHLIFEYQVRVTYADNSVNVLPSGTTYYQKKTQNTTKTFVPGNYKFQVWIARRIWWIIYWPVAYAERNVSIVGVLIRGPDQWWPPFTCGSHAPKFVPLLPEGEEPEEPVKLKACVLPEQAPNGEDLAQTYRWSDAPKLTMTGADKQETEVEPKGEDASTELDDQEIELEVQLTGGKKAAGVAQFVFTKGAEDEPHKMTLIKVDIAVDSNNDARITDEDDLLEELAPGCVLPVNLFGDGAGSDKVARVRLSIEPDDLEKGSVTLQAGPGIQFWESAAQSGAIVLPAVYDPPKDLPDELYVDGTVRNSNPDVELVFKDEDGDEVYTDRLKISVTETPSWSPAKKDTAYVWSSLPSLGTADGVEFENQLKDQGFTVTWRSDPTGASDNNFGGCTFANYRDMRACGIFTVISHGEKGGHLAVYAQDSPAGKAAVDAWRGVEANIITVRTADASGSFYTARVSSTWLSGNWKPHLDSNRSIALWSICYSATGSATETSVKDAAGGRWRSGYVEPTNETEAKGVNKRFLERMNGSDGFLGFGAGKKRTAGGAYESGSGYTANLRMGGNSWTTLCPSPMLDAAVFPTTSPGVRKGWGCVIFDTYMNDTISAQDAVVKLSGCPTSNFRWVGTAAGNYIVGFDYDNTAGSGATMRAVSDKCKNQDADGGRKLDGNRQKPNGDDRDWSF